MRLAGDSAGSRPVLITGASGFLGRHVVRQARDGNFNVLATARQATPGIDIACDLTDRWAVAALIKDFRPSAVVHLAARVPSSPNAYENETAARDNLGMVEVLLDALLDIPASGRKTQCPAVLVFASSITVYGRAMPERLDESHPIGGLTGYAAAKHRAETLLREKSPIPVVSLRLPGLFGAPRRSGLVYNLFRQALAGKPPLLDADPPLWSGLAVADAAWACLQPCRTLHRPSGPRPPDGELPEGVFNVGYNEPLSLERAARRIYQVVGTALPALAEAPVCLYDGSRFRARYGALPGGFADRLATYRDWIVAEGLPS